MTGLDGGASSLPEDRRRLGEERLGLGGAAALGEQLAAGGGFTTGGNGVEGNSGGGAGQGGSRMMIAGFPDVGNGSGGAGAGCGGGSPDFMIPGDFAGKGGNGIVNCLGSGGGGGGGAGLGGALYVRSGTVSLSGVTFTDNEARRGAGAAGGSGGADGRGKGGALFVDRDGAVDLVTDPTFAGNVADDDLAICTDNDTSTPAATIRPRHRAG